MKSIQTWKSHIFVVVMALTASATALADYSSLSWPELLGNPRLKLDFPAVNFGSGYTTHLNDVCLFSDDVLRTEKPVPVCVSNSVHRYECFSGSNETSDSCLPLGAGQTPHGYVTERLECDQVGESYLTVSRHTMNGDYPMHLNIRIYVIMPAKDTPELLPAGAKSYDVPRCN